MANTKRKRVSKKTHSDYRIPALWNCWGYDGPATQLGKEIIVQPSAYLRACRDWIDAHAVVTGRFVGRSLSQTRGVKSVGRMKVKDGGHSRRGGDWIKSQIMYGMMIRTSTAWDHDGDGQLNSRRVNELGTFLKTILLLPHLRRMGMTCLYLLPVVKVSHLYRKGELGCPYSAKNVLELDPAQADDAFGLEYGDVNNQFRLLMRCAHGLGMRVMLDVAPRTAARDSDWILDNPEWFYWIDRRYEKNYQSPHIPDVTYYNPVPGKLHEIYDAPEVRDHLKKFRFAPSVTDRQRWDNFVTAARKKPPANLLAAITKHFSLITPPGFSDVVNDRQPPWSDVTYLRLFADHPPEAVRHLPDPAKQPPYVLYDTAKASLFPGKKPMRALWNRLAGIIPFYQRFGVDGARVDMAHALPVQLEESILDKPRRRDPDFSFLAEELGTGNHRKAHRSGYNFIIGPSWWMQPRSHEGFMHKLIAEAPSLKVPIMAAAETPDTPRAATRHGARKFARQAIVVNAFLPNAIPMINGGMELFERQPMNLGLDAKPRDRFALPKTDPLYGKLAFFDKFALHWNNPGSQAMIELIAKVNKIRHQYELALTNPKNYIAPKLTTNASRILATAYRLGPHQGTLLMLANLDYKKTRRTTITNLPKRKGNPAVLLHIADSPSPKKRAGTISVTLDASEAVVMLT